MRDINVWKLGSWFIQTRFNLWNLICQTTSSCIEWMHLFFSQVVSLSLVSSGETTSSCLWFCNKFPVSLKTSIEEERQVFIPGHIRNYTLLVVLRLKLLFRVTSLFDSFIFISIEWLRYFFHWNRNGKLFSPSINSLQSESRKRRKELN